MILWYLRTALKAHTAARNYRILSELDDDMLRDIGLDRRTLRMFCDNGCGQLAASADQPGIPLADMSPYRLRSVMG